MKLAAYLETILREYKSTDFNGKFQIKTFLAGKRSTRGVKRILFMNQR